MKKITVVLSLVLFALVSCNEAKHTEGEEESVHTPGTAVVDAIEELSKADEDSTKSKSDSTKFVCSCEHKCSTKEICEKTCGPECSKK